MTIESEENLEKMAVEFLSLKAYKWKPNRKKTHNILYCKQPYSMDYKPTGTIVAREDMKFFMDVIQLDQELLKLIDKEAKDNLRTKEAQITYMVSQYYLYKTELKILRAILQSSDPKAMYSRHLQFSVDERRKEYKSSELEQQTDNRNKRKLKSDFDPVTAHWPWESLATSDEEREQAMLRKYKYK